MRIFCLFVIAACFSSCVGTFYQVNVVKSDLSKTNNAYFFENEDCKVSYDFRDFFILPYFTKDYISYEVSNYKNPKLIKKPGHFIFENKTDKNIYLVLSQTSFVYNSLSRTYYQDTDGDKISMTKNLPAICIAPHSFRYIYNIEELGKLGQLISQESKEQAYPKIKSKPLIFQEDNSPVKFQYYISYSFSPEITDPKMIKNSFYVGEIINYKGEVKKETYKVGEDKYKNTLFEVRSPDRFHRTYYK